MQELKLNDIQVIQGSINITDELANNIIANAEEVANIINSQNVDESNIKEIKKMLAEAKKVQKKLNDKKLEIKKEYMQPYAKLEALIKESKEIIETAEKELREQTKELEDKDKQDKFNEIQEVFDLEVENHNLKGLVNFSDWFRKEFLNKTYTMKKVNENLQLFLMRIWNDLQVIKTLNNPEFVLYEYLRMDESNVYEAQISAESKLEKVNEIKSWLNEN